ncbi:hypothetical protein M407DRAFT_28323 [Tulasnella calospora MUT 4182]|uniref:Cytochrome P450 n=1 Tax=Tulasnella calospora MUT 4182 TaxID=1051891 RepID=A0A0C3LL61_9AGAM|nr:hypothetical protein M407DRAFT_28323 [Tulasnella calospora MUT 4182]
MFDAENQLSVYAAFATVFLSLYAWLLIRDRTQRSDEPPYYPYLIPGLGHALRYADNQRFYFRVRQYFSSRQPYSLRFPGNKAYVVSDPADVTIVYRNSTALSFDTYIERGIAFVYGVRPLELGSPVGSPTLRDVVKGGTAANGTVVENSHVYSRRYLLQESALDDLTRRTALEVSRLLDTCEFGQEIGLHKWSRAILPTAVTNAIYGPGLLEAHPDLIDKIWEFDDSFHKILSSPPFLLRKVYNTRHELYRIFSDYVRDDDHGEQMREGAFGLATARAENLKEAGSSVQMRAGCEIPLFHALHANATPTAFWVLAYILSTLGLKDRILQEISPAFKRRTMGNDEPDIDITYLVSPKSCPLIHSCLYEAMRLTSGSLSTRLVEKPTSIGPYTLYPRNSVFVPSRVAHLAEDYWGPDVLQFDPDRFIKRPEELRPGNMWLRPFGGGATICPGRQYAGNEVKLFVAGVLRRFEVELRSGSAVPPVDYSIPSAGMMKPAYDLTVKLTRKVFQT